MESTHLIIIGLIFDIIGVVLIISPWLYFQRWTPNRVMREHMEGITDHVEAKKRNLQRDLILIGFAFLVIGFILQIIGNWYQTPTLT